MKGTVKTETRKVYTLELSGDEFGELVAAVREARYGSYYGTLTAVDYSLPPGGRYDRLFRDLQSIRP